MRCISVVIVLHNSADVIGDCLSSLPRDVEIVVVDNGSTDRVLEALSSRNLRLIRLNENLGFGAGCNRGAAVASGDVIVFLNPDTVVEDGTVQRLAEHVRRDRRIVVGPAIFDAEGRLLHVCRRRTSLLQEIGEILPPVSRMVAEPRRRDVSRRDRIYVDGGEVPYLQGACIAVDAGAFRRVGGFDENFFLYYEEEDLCERLRAAGAHCIYDPGAVIHHHWGTSTGKVPLLSFRERYRSFVLFYAKRHGRARASAAAALIVSSLLVRAVLILVLVAAGKRPQRRLPWVLASIRGATAGLRGAS